MFLVFAPAPATVASQRFTGCGARCDLGAQQKHRVAARGAGSGAPGEDPVCANSWRRPSIAFKVSSSGRAGAAVDIFAQRAIAIVDLLASAPADATSWPFENSLQLIRLVALGLLLRLRRWFLPAWTRSVGVRSNVAVRASANGGQPAGKGSAPLLRAHATRSGSRSASIASHRFAYYSFVSCDHILFELRQVGVWD